MAMSPLVVACTSTLLIHLPWTHLLLSLDSKTGTRDRIEIYNIPSTFYTSNIGVTNTQLGMIVQSSTGTSSTTTLNSFRTTSKR